MDPFDIASEEELDSYITKLPKDIKCRFMIETGLELCDCEHNCRFQGKDNYTLRNGTKKECKRPRVIEMMRILGQK